MDDSGGGGAPPFLMTLDDTATDVFLHLLLPGGAPCVHYLCAWACAVVLSSSLTSASDSTVGSNPKSDRHMQLTAPDIQPVRQSRSCGTTRLFNFIISLIAKIHAVISCNASEVRLRAHGNAAALAVSGVMMMTHFISSPTMRLIRRRLHAHPLRPSPRTPTWRPPRCATLHTPTYRACDVTHAPPAGFGDHAEFRLCLPWEAARARALGASAAGDAHTPKRIMRERSSGTKCRLCVCRDD